MPKESPRRVSLAPRPSVVPTRYAVCALPTAHPDYESAVISVEPHGPGWVVIHQGRFLSVTGTWDFQPRVPNEADYRYDRDTAIEYARRAAPYVQVAGRTAADIAADTY